MVLFQSTIIRNRLLATRTQDDFSLIEPNMERVPMPLQKLLIEAHRPIQYVYFPESGIVSTIADSQEGRIEIGLIGREGIVGVSAVLGVDQIASWSRA